jgi:hypothetical protein
MRSWALALMLGIGTVGCGVKESASPAKSGAEAPAEVVTKWRGSRVSMSTPPELRRLSNATELRMTRPEVALVVIEVTAANVEGVLGGLKKQLGVQDELPVTRGAAKGFMGAAQSEETKETNKQTSVLALAAANAGVLIVADYEADAAPIVKRVLSTVQLDATARLDPLALHGVQVGDMAGFEVSDEISTPIKFVEKGKSMLPAAAFELKVMPAPSDAAVAGLSEALFSEARASSTVSDFKKEARTIAGQPAVVATFTDQQDGQPIGGYLVVAQSAGSVMIGASKAVLADHRELVPRLERLMGSLQLDPSLSAP